MIKIKEKLLNMKGKEFLVLRIILVLSIFVPVTVFALRGNVATEGFFDEISERLRNRILAAGGKPQIIHRSESVCRPADLRRFYDGRGFRPAWIAERGPLPQARFLVKAIRESDCEGLRPGDYHLSSIESLLSEMRQNKNTNVWLDPEKLVDFDLLLTDAFLTYGFHLLYGRVNPETIYPDWLVYNRKVDLSQVLQIALNLGQIKPTLEDQLSPNSAYLRLRRALMRYRSIAKTGGWPTVPDGPEMQKGCRGSRVVVLRNRLIASDDLEPFSVSKIDLFDDLLEQAVRKFQERHGIMADGFVGSATLAALNVPVQERLEQIKLNMERWHWGSHYFGKRYILVNTASFELKVVEDGRTTMTTRAVIGRSDRPTPVCNGKITHIVLNPYWHVPLSIAIEDILPKVQKDLDYLTDKNIRVFKIRGDEDLEIDPTMVDWSRLSTTNFAYKLRQEPGPLNALGSVKFIFPNRFCVSIHDTPARGLFQKTQRDFSSGCIRIEDSLDLTEYLLRRDYRWRREEILAAINERVNQVVRLPEPIPVHLVYWTTWVDDDGSIQFRNDIYGRDKVLAQALNEGPLAPSRSLMVMASVRR